MNLTICVVWMEAMNANGGIPAEVMRAVVSAVMVLWCCQFTWGGDGILEWKAVKKVFKKEHLQQCGRIEGLPGMIVDGDLMFERTDARSKNAYFRRKRKNGEIIDERKGEKGEIIYEKKGKDGVIMHGRAAKDGDIIYEMKEENDLISYVKEREDGVVVLHGRKDNDGEILFQGKGIDGSEIFEKEGKEGEIWHGKKSEDGMKYEKKRVEVGRHKGIPHYSDVIAELPALYRGLHSPDHHTLRHFSYIEWRKKDEIEVEEEWAHVDPWQQQRYEMRGVIATTADSEDCMEEIKRYMKSKDVFPRIRKEFHMEVSEECCTSFWLLMYDKHTQQIIASPEEIQKAIQPFEEPIFLHPSSTQLDFSIRKEIALIGAGFLSNYFYQL